MPDPLAIVDSALRALRPGGFLDTTAGAARYIVKDPREKGASARDALVLSGVLPGRWGGERAIGSVRERRKLANYVHWGRTLGWDRSVPSFAQDSRRLDAFNRGHLSLSALAHDRYVHKGVFDLIGKASRSNRWSMVVSEAASWVAKREATAQFLGHPRARRGAKLAASAARRAYPAFEIVSGTFGLLFPPTALGTAGAWIGRGAAAAGIAGGAASTRLALSRSNQPVRAASAFALVGMLGAGTYAAYRAVAFVATYAHVPAALALGTIASLGVGGLVYRKVRARREQRAEERRHQLPPALREWGPTVWNQRQRPSVPPRRR